MKSSKKFAILSLLLSLGAGALLFHSQSPVRAADETTAAEDKDKDGDKWAEVMGNNRKMLEEMKTIEENMNFARVRAMQRR